MLNQELGRATAPTSPVKEEDTGSLISKPSTSLHSDLQAHLSRTFA